MICPLTTQLITIDLITKKSERISPFAFILRSFSGGGVPRAGLFQRDLELILRVDASISSTENTNQ